MKKKLLIATALLALVLVLLSVWQILLLRKAHSSFENYYAFRGCAQLLEKRDDYGICKISSGKTIKIVKYKGRWYLDGDLPCGSLFCL